MTSSRPARRTLLRAASVAACLLLLALVPGCAGSASVSIKTGYFFGHDLRQVQHVVYVLDMSGSMSEHSGTVVEDVGTTAAGKAAGAVSGGLMGSAVGKKVEDRVTRLKKKVEKVKLHVIASLQGLPPTAYFNLVLFSNGVQLLSPVPLQANGLVVAAVQVFVDRLEEGGGTNMYAALEAALQAGPAHIILLTDGLPTSSTPEQILELARRYNANRDYTISTVGVGIDQARGFLSALAQENGGAFTTYN